MTKIRVKLARGSYNVIISAGLIGKAGKEIRQLLPSPKSRVLVVTSNKVRRHWGAALEASLRKAKLDHAFLEMDDGEPAKRLEMVEQLAEKMVELGADRNALVVAFGGGVIGDSAGFLAAIFMRGVPVIQVPTTVVAQVDASIGGKTGVNLRAGKNLVGAFHQPKAVLIDPEVLDTLDEREFRSGLYESLKCGVIRDRRLFDFMTRNATTIQERNPKALLRVIVDSVKVKADVVSADERESDLRRILNFGHTIGHALEAATGYTALLHGEAVGWGMMAAAEIGSETGSCSVQTAAQIRAAVLDYGPLPSVQVNVEQVLAKLSSDKKTVGGTVHFVLPEKIGKVRVKGDVKREIIRQAVENISS